MSISSPPASSPLSLSLFALLRDQFGAMLQPLRCTKATLVHISHTIEDLVLTERLPALLFTGFQESSHWREETERYRALATIAQQVCIFSGGALPPESSASELHVVLQGDDPLRQEWFLALLSAKFSVILCGQDRQTSSINEAMRQFDTLWSFQPALIEQVLDLLEDVVGGYRPERLEALREARRRFPPTAPDPDLVTRFTAELIRFEEELHQRLAATQYQLEQQTRWREDLVAMLVHDLANPLQAVVLTMDLLSTPGELSSDEYQEVLEQGSRSVQQACSQVQLILDTNQLAEGELRLSMARLDSAHWMESALLSCRVQAQRAGVALECEVQVPSLWADGVLLARALQNLVINGLKFTPAGGRIQATLAPAPQAGWVELRVRDTGRGISVEDLPTIFERYQQGRRKDRRGHGLGLYFCRLVAEAHSGSIHAASAPGAGTVFTLTLPVLPRSVVRG